MMEMSRTFYAPDRAAWRTWLQGHHMDESEVWLVYYKRHTSQASIPYDDSVEEALCFGWVDSLIQRIDDERYARLFTPRREGSQWSESNKWRVRKMAAEGQMTQAGMARVDFPLDEPPEEHPTPQEIALSDALLAMLEENAVAWEQYNHLPPSHRRNYNGWIMSAKKEETRRRRLAETVEMLAQGKRLGMK
jgi:uncharacterized protein YdeI (YjbR/CyaY-like superfamily)